jgi:Leucine-rich repeat (LRR) protein
MRNITMVRLLRKPEITSKAIQHSRVLVGIVLIGSVLIACGSPQRKGSMQPRTINFPTEYSLGLLVNLDSPAFDYDDERSPLYARRDHFSERCEQVALASGEVNAPAGMRLGLIIDPQSAKQVGLPVLLKGIPPDAIEALCVKREITKSQSSSIIIDDAAMTALCTLTSLKELYLERLRISEDISDEALAQLSNLQSLENLYINRRKIEASRTIPHIAKIKSLKRLYCLNPGHSLSFLSQLPALEYLRIGGGNVGPEGLQHLADFPALHRLEFYDLTREGVAVLPAMPSLRELHIQRKGIGLELEHMAGLARQTGLESLSLTARYTDDGLAHLKKLQSLRKLGLHGLMQDRDYITDEGLAHIKEIKSLESIIIYTGQFTDAGLAHLSELKNLKKLHMPGNTGFTDAGLAHIAKLDHLESLYLRGNKFTKSGLKELSKLKNLKTVKFFSPSSDAKAFLEKHNIVAQSSVSSK